MRHSQGYCYHLFTKHHHETMADFQLPEMLRTPLEEMVLQLKVGAAQLLGEITACSLPHGTMWRTAQSLKLGAARSFLAKALEPPSESAVTAAVSILTSLAALDAAEELTPLG